MKNVFEEGTKVGGKGEKLAELTCAHRDFHCVSSTLFRHFASPPLWGSHSRPYLQAKVVKLLEVSGGQELLRAGGGERQRKKITAATSWASLA